MGFFDGVAGIWTIATWPMDAAGAFKNGGAWPMVAAASVAAGVGASYYVLGNPLTLIQDQNVVEAGAFYVGTGVVYYVSMQIGNQVVAATQKM